MKLTHWSSDIVTRVHGQHQARDPWNERGKRWSGVGKPAGFWLSDETRGELGWRRWARDNGFQLWRFRYRHEVVLSKNAKILHIRTGKQLDEFADKYGIDAPWHDSSDDLEVWGGRYISYIDWHRVAKKYHGIIIPPYQWSRRMGRHMWYYGWDCASGCIWNARAVESITMVREYKVPRKPTRREMVRKHKRDMVRMAEASKRLVKSLDESGQKSVFSDAVVSSADKLIESVGGSK